MNSSSSSSSSTSSFTVELPVLKIRILAARYYTLRLAIGNKYMSFSAPPHMSRNSSLVPRLSLARDVDA